MRGRGGHVKEEGLGMEERDWEGIDGICRSGGLGGEK